MRRTDQRRAAVVALYQRDLTARPLTELVPRDATPFTRELIDGVVAEGESLDELIERHSVGWTLDRIAPLERSILRVALYELLHRADVPDEVAIDEAVEAAKELCSADTPKFVNGILGAVQREREPREAR
jgi:N utilization substance protein B